MLQEDELLREIDMDMDENIKAQNTQTIIKPIRN